VHSINNHLKCFAVAVNTASSRNMNVAITNDRSASSLDTIDILQRELHCKRSQVYAHLTQPPFIVEGFKGH
jgi:hypothetical protein